MSDKFIKAYCSASRQYFGLKIEEVSGALRVTDFYDLSESEGKMLASTVDVPNLETAPNLRTCSGCGSRRVASCTCAKKKCRCEPNQGYRYQCLYCRDLHIWSVNEGAENYDPSATGKVVRLAQGQEVVISAVGPAALEHILVGVGWEIALTGRSMDVDSSVLVKSSRTGRGELVYFGHLNHSSGCVEHLGDNLVGGKNSKSSEATDSENINVYLNKVPDQFDQLYFILNIYDCEARGQTFRNVRDLYIRLTNAKNRKTLVEYTVDQVEGSMTGLIIGKAYRSGSNWMFKALGRGVRVKNVHELESCCTD